MASILCLAGSLRSAASSKAVVGTIRDRLADMASFTGFDIGSLPHYNADLDPLPEMVVAFKDAIAEADDLIIVTPEYNYTMPDVLKNAIDWASRPGCASVFKDSQYLLHRYLEARLAACAQAHLKNVLNAVLARTFIWQEVAIANANAKVKADRLADEPTEMFLLDVVHAYMTSIKEQ